MESLVERAAVVTEQFKKMCDFRHLGDFRTHLFAYNFFVTKHSHAPNSLKAARDQDASIAVCGSRLVAREPGAKIQNVDEIFIFEMETPLDHCLPGNFLALQRHQKTSHTMRYNLQSSEVAIVSRNQSLLEEMCRKA